MRGAAILDEIHNGRFVSAERQARQLVGEAVAQHPDSSAAVAQALDVLVECLWYSSSKRDSSSIALAQRAVELKQKLHGPRDARLAFSLTNLGVLLDESGRGEARAAHERAVATARSELAPDDPLLARALKQYGAHLTTADQYAEASQVLQHSLTILQRASGLESLQVASVLNQLARCAWRQGDYTRARA